MTWLEASVQLLQAALWPGVVLVTIALFREQLRGLLTRVQELKGPGGLELLLEQQTKKVVADDKLDEVQKLEVIEGAVQASKVSSAAELNHLLKGLARTLAAERPGVFANSLIERSQSEGPLTTSQLDAVDALLDGLDPEVRRVVYRRIDEAEGHI